MSYEPGRRYDGKIVAADYYTAQSGDLALWCDVQADNEPDTLRHFLWLKDDSKERTAKTLAEFGINVSDAAFWENPEVALADKRCDFTTKTGKNGKVQTQYLNGPLRKAPAATQADRKAAASKAASMFSVGDYDAPAF